MHMLENNAFFWKTMGVFKQCFLTRLHTWFIFNIKHMHFIKIKTFHVLHKVNFHNTIPYRSCRKSLRFFSAHILKLCFFFPEMCVKNAKRRPKITTGYAYYFLWQSYCLEAYTDLWLTEVSFYKLKHYC